MAELSYFYVDNGRRTLRLGRSAYLRMRDRMIRGEHPDAHEDLFECASSAETARDRFHRAEQWPPELDGEH